MQSRKNLGNHGWSSSSKRCSRRIERQVALLDSLVIAIDSDRCSCGALPAPGFGALRSYSGPASVTPAARRDVTTTDTHDKQAINGKPFYRFTLETDRALRNLLMCAS